MLFRIGRAPNPLAAPPRPYVGGGRYDDPRDEFVVLYAAQERRCAFIETLDAYRPAISDLAMLLLSREGGAQTPKSGVVPQKYFDKMIGTFRLLPAQRWLDLRSPETHQVLRAEMAGALIRLGYGKRFVLGDVLGSDHRLTREIARWAFEQGYQGIAYASCHDPSLTCWAIFEGAEFVVVAAPEPVRRADLDFVAVVRLFGLTLP